MYWRLSSKYSKYASAIACDAEEEEDTMGADTDDDVVRENDAIDGHAENVAPDASARGVRADAEDTDTMPKTMLTNGSVECVAARMPTAAIR